jgi:hypothetical protein
VSGLSYFKSISFLKGTIKYNCFVLFLLFCALSGGSQTVSVREEKAGLAISFQNEVRLQGGIGVVGKNVKPFKIEKRVSKNIALLSVRCDGGKNWRR